MEGWNNCRKKNKMFTGVVWGLGVRNPFFSAFSCGFCVTTWEKKRYFKICMCELGRKAAFHPWAGRSGCLFGRLPHSTVIWDVMGLATSLHLMVRAPFSYSPRNSPSWLNFYFKSDAGWETRSFKSLRTSRGNTRLCPKQLLFFTWCRHNTCERWGFFFFFWVGRVKTSRRWIKAHFQPKRRKTPLPGCHSVTLQAQSNVNFFKPLSASLKINCSSHKPNSGPDSNAAIRFRKVLTISHIQADRDMEQLECSGVQDGTGTLYNWEPGLYNVKPTLAPWPKDTPQDLPLRN